MQVVWFKRDLRIHDHRPLVEAAARGPVLCLYVYEPDVIDAPDFDPSHLHFINESLAELDAALRARGARLTYRHGLLPDVFEALHRRKAITRLWSHRETGARHTYDRDLRVADWCAARGVEWTEIPQDGVIRRLANRDGWARRWNARMNEPLVAPPARIDVVKGIAAEGLRRPRDLGLPEANRPEAQRGGEAVARATLDSFLEYRGVNYTKDMSSPLTGWYGCSRLSPHLAWGNISMRTVYQEAAAKADEMRALRKAGAETDRRWLGSLSSFMGRLRWHCHFMQKLEDEPRIEFENLSPVYDGLREDAFEEERFARWCAGQTGYPMVDACMRALHASGWINFRMRAMLISFASYHLWLHWRRPALHLARLFLDYEPGIHYSQTQMQSGTTGINTVRIYSPIKQVRDHDPRGWFIRRYVPELAGIPDAFLAEPHRMTAAEQRAAGCVIGRDYPAPIVDHDTAYKAARERMYALRRGDQARSEAQAIVAKHGSRRRPNRRRTGGKPSV